MTFKTKDVSHCFTVQSDEKPTLHRKSCPVAAFSHRFTPGAAHFCLQDFGVEAAGGCRSPQPMGLSGSMVELSAMIYGLDCIGLVLGCFTVYYTFCN